MIYMHDSFQARTILLHWKAQICNTISSKSECGPTLLCTVREEAYKECVCVGVHVCVCGGGTSNGKVHVLMIFIA